MERRSGRDDQAAGAAAELDRSGARSSSPTSAIRAARGRTRCSRWTCSASDGTTAYSHDVQVDDDGIAWVSGDGGTRGYYTDGRQWDPVERRYRRASPAGAGPLRRRRAPAVGHQRHHRRLRAQRRTAGRPQRPTRRRPLPQGRTAAGHRGGLRPRSRRLQEPGPVHDRLAEGLATTARPGSRPRPSPFRLQVVGKWSPFAQEGTRPVPVPRPLPAAGELLLGALLRRRRQPRDLRLVRRGHALPGHLGPGQSAPGRLLAA